MTRRLVFFLVVLLCTAGVGVGVTAAEPGSSVAADGTVETVEPPTAQSISPSSTDDLGCVDGICHDDNLEFETTTALSDDELDALIARTMARVQVLRGEQFTEPVPVEIQSRETFRDSDIANPPGRDESFNRWNDQVWKALFVVGEDDSAATAISGTVGESVNGFYQPGENRIVLITSSPESPTVDEQTLLHELVHALQDQRHGLSGPQFRGETQDGDLAVNGILEGETMYLEAEYEQRCDAGEWSCFDRPASGGGGSASNLGILFTLFQPYSDGPAYVHELVEREGWAGVDDRFEEPPETTREIIHREPVDAVRLDVTDEATDGWQQYPHQGVAGAETVGEASMFVMFWYQAREYGADTVDPGILRDSSHKYAQYNYVSEPSSGWAGDELVPYRRDDTDGYVWGIEWETRADTAEFRRAYGAILDAHNATETDDGVYLVDDGPFRGAYAVEVDGTRLTVVHAPTEAGLFELRPSLDPSPLDGGPILVDDIPGFGMPAALAALTALAVFVVGRRRCR